MPQRQQCSLESTESILCGSLFPPEFPMKGRVEYLVLDSSITHLDKFETKTQERLVRKMHVLFFINILCKLILSSF
ncbi:hypothetical protein BS78_06G010200 [Paspalum vaginatum]|nr:hypothetical protein BS78_06G010200 [Paspalum vaginatum]